MTPETARDAIRIIQELNDRLDEQDKKIKELEDGRNIYKKSFDDLMSQLSYTNNQVPLPEANPEINSIIFLIPVKEIWDEDAKAWVYLNEEYNISGYGKSKKEAGDLVRDIVHNILVFNAPENGGKTEGIFSELPPFDADIKRVSNETEGDVDDEY